MKSQRFNPSTAHRTTIGKVMKKCPFNIPLVRYGTNVGIVAQISEMTTERVKGKIEYPSDSSVVHFDVKHDGRMFAVGSGSAKQRFYFENWNKE
jgi:hypothetical protein